MRKRLSLQGVIRSLEAFFLLRMEQPGKKQIGHYLRYKLAFERLDEALEEGWLLEAISLEKVLSLIAFYQLCKALQAKNL